MFIEGCTGRHQTCSGKISQSGQREHGSGRCSWPGFCSCRSRPWRQVQRHGRPGVQANVNVGSSLAFSEIGAASCICEPWSSQSTDTGSRGERRGRARHGRQNCVGTSMIHRDGNQGWMKSLAMCGVLINFYPLASDTLPPCQMNCH
jgi:hypothetical protein